MNRALITIACVLVAGCCCNHKAGSVSQSPRITAPDAKNYVHVYPTDYSIYVRLTGLRTGAIAQFAKAFDERAGTNCPAVGELAARLITQEDQLWASIAKRANEVQALKDQGALICWFEWRDSNRTEKGVLALKDGRIIDREVWFTEPIETTKPKQIEN